MRRAALSGFYQLPVQGLAGCHLAGKSGSTGAADAVLRHADEMWPHFNYSIKYIYIYICPRTHSLVMNHTRICFCSVSAFSSWCIIKVLLTRMLILI